MSFGPEEQKDVEIIANIFSRLLRHHVASFNSKACLNIATLVQRLVWILHRKCASTIKDGWRESLRHNLRPTSTSSRKVDPDEPSIMIKSILTFYLFNLFEMMCVEQYVSRVYIYGPAKCDINMLQYTGVKRKQAQQKES